MKSASKMQNIIITINNNNEAHAPNTYHSKKTTDTFIRLSNSMKWMLKGSWENTFFSFSKTPCISLFLFF